jgi:hypothetical protein
MPQFIIKLPDKGTDYYLVWSTVVDAPITCGMSLEEFKDYYKHEYGRTGMEQLEDRLKRVEENGCSAYNETLDDLPICNRAGEHESHLTKEQILKRYCTNLTPAG